MATVKARVWGVAKTAALTAGRRAFRAAAPLLAPAMAACAIAAPVDGPPCDEHNRTTVTINQEEFEGGVLAAVEELRTPDGFLGEELARALRVSHSLATSGLPGGFPTTVTRSSDECLVNPNTGNVAAAYAIGPYNKGNYLYSGEYGVYTSIRQLTLDDFSLLAHEIGHLQTPCAEVGAELNAAEQMLMLAAAYSMQGSPRDAAVWAAQELNQLFGLEALYDALRHIYDDGFRLDPDPGISIRMHPKAQYIEADTLILDALRRHGGDFAAVRAEFEAQDRQQLEAAAEESVAGFVGRHSGATMQESLAEIITELRMLRHRELHRRFGAEAAGDYFGAHSGNPYRMGDVRGMVAVFGLDGMDCIIVEPAAVSVEIPCDDECTGYGAVRAVRLTGSAFRCFTVENEAAPSFREWSVSADGTGYVHAGGSLASVDGISCNAVIVFDHTVRNPL